MQIWYVFVMIYFYCCIKYWGIGYEIPIILPHGLSKIFVRQPNFGKLHLTVGWNIRSHQFNLRMEFLYKPYCIDLTVQAIGFNSILRSYECRRVKKLKLLEKSHQICLQNILLLVLMDWNCRIKYNEIYYHWIHWLGFEYEEKVWVTFDSYKVVYFNFSTKRPSYRVCKTWWFGHSLHWNHSQHNL